MNLSIRLVLVFLVGLSIAPKAQVQLPKLHDSLFTTYYHQRNTLFQMQPITKGDILFVGNSITDGSEWSELFNDLRIKNRGISGDNTNGVLHRINEICTRRPAKIFLMIGVNDLSQGISPDTVVKNILLISDYIHQESPSTKLFVQSILPVSNDFKKFSGHTSKKIEIESVNAQLQKQAGVHHYNFINLYPFFCNEQGKIAARYTNDGLHLLGEGYFLWKHLIYAHVYDLQERAALIPAPIHFAARKGFFPLYKTIAIRYNDSALAVEAGALQTLMLEKGLRVNRSSIDTAFDGLIELRLIRKSISKTNEEAYTLTVGEKNILITGATPRAIFNGIQTLRQLMRDGVMIDACEINDVPTFSWRGFMIDVGRNYMPMHLLKEQIDVMASYKFNVFHFHATEDIAWRFEIATYPQLTAPETMLRNKGQYYTKTEIQELIQFCNERHILFLPEIDMPGHSAAFQRAMKTDMQSDTGLVYVKNILKEICTTYDVPYIHIGADEVKINNKNFIPAVTAYIEHYGKKVIGWQPGGNFTDQTIRQLWREDNQPLSTEKNIRYIDSKHLYLNHMDPLESVTTIFNRRICDRDQGDSLVIGATLCVWHDRAIRSAEDVLTMNPVYPGILAFAERTWRGGGVRGWVANVSDGDIQAFSTFENSLLDHKKLYFKGKPFPYFKQNNREWNLYGPYVNDGDLSKHFEPEKLIWTSENLTPVKKVVGGTIVLRHWWAPLIKGAIDQPGEQTTWYASTTIESDEDVVKEYWIGFNNLSRSPATDSPPINSWDAKGSVVWVNGAIIEPPHWVRAGQKGHAEIPLIDEGYEYRRPTLIHLKKGVNTVLLKMPVGTFKATNWQAPVKWMFTFLETDFQQ